jgi:hypothetical protein
MSKQTSRNSLSRRDFLKLGGGAMVAAAGVSLMPAFRGRLLKPVSMAEAAPNQQTALTQKTLHWVGTDGWIHLPPSPAIPPYHPDDLAPPPFTTYIFGFRNLTGLPDSQMIDQKMKAQATAPLFWLQVGDELKMSLTNLGLAQRPDLFDSHTIHWHGFRNVIPFFDGEPMGSVAVPAGRTFTYDFRPKDAGTYMYHCHVEDVEHVHMGMTGMVFVRPASNPKWAYEDASTAFDREFSMMLTEVWAEAHWADAHIQLPEWSDYRADFALMNGRVYPDTIAPNGSIDPFNPVRDANGDLIPPAGHPELQYQPLSSLVRCNAGDRVLLRMASLGYTEASMTLTGIKMHVVGKDATLLRGRDGTDNSYLTNTVSLHAGESADAIFTAPAFQGPGTSDPDIGANYNKYLFYNRSYTRHDNLAGPVGGPISGYGGQMTEVRVFPAGTLPAQTLPNT